MLTRHGLYVLVDLHQDGWGPSLGSDGFPDWMTLTNGATNTHTDFPLYYVTNPAIQAAFQSLWDDATGPGGVALQDQVASVWSALAGAVGQVPGVLGYDLLNEPWPGTTWQPCLGTGGCPTQDAALDAYDARMATAIRAHDPTHLLFGEPYVLFNFGLSPTNVGLPGGDASSGLSWHMYTTDPSFEPDVIQFASSWSAQTGGALLNTEFGAVTDPPDIDRMVGELDGALMPWIWWSYDEEVVKDLTQPPTGTNIDQPVADALVRPHPLAVAGTPTADDYDTTTDTLTFSYSTARPGGGAYECGTLTSIQVPRAVYAHGYHVTVTGGVVVSPPRNEHLEIVADRGASSVSVTVSPGRPTPRSTAAAACA
jgi:endoglycosylceramidase